MCLSVRLGLDSLISMIDLGFAKENIRSMSPMTPDPSSALEYILSFH